MLQGEAALEALCGSSVVAPEGAAARAALCGLLLGATAVRAVDDSDLAAVAPEEWGEGASRHLGSWLHNSSAVQQYFAHMHCAEMVDTHEASRGLRYERVVVSRYDLRWLAPHPPLSLLDGNFLWVPHSDHNRGLNDRHAVLARDHVGIYLGSWLALLSGRAGQLIDEAKTSRRFEGEEVSAEAWLKIRLDAHGIPVMFFPGTAHVVCADTGLPSRSETPCARGRLYKHRGEFSTATRSAACLVAGACQRGRAVAASTPGITAKWSEPLLIRCVECVNDWLELRARARMNAIVDTLGAEAWRRIVVNDWPNAVFVLQEFAGVLQSMPESWSAGTLAGWILVPVPPGGGCGSGFMRLGTTALRWRRKSRLRRAASAMDAYAAAITRLPERSAERAIISSTPLSPRRLCSFWRRALALA